MISQPTSNTSFIKFLICDRKINRVASTLFRKPNVPSPLYSVLEITLFFAGSKHLLLSVKVDSKTNIPGSKAGCHLTALLASTLVLVRCKTKQNSIWSKTLRNCVQSYN